jgi:hypothetical protein
MSTIVVVPDNSASPARRRAPGRAAPLALDDGKPLVERDAFGGLADRPGPRHRLEAMQTRRDRAEPLQVVQA